MLQYNKFILSCIEQEKNGTACCCPKAVSNVFSANASIVRESTTITQSTKYAFGIVTQTTGRRTEITSASAGSTSAPCYVYAEGRSDNLAMSSVGIGCNLGNISVDSSIGLGEQSARLSYAKENTTTSLGFVGDVWSMQMGFEYAVTTNTLPTVSETSFVSISINLMPAVVIVGAVALTAVGVPAVGFA